MSTSFRAVTLRFASVAALLAASVCGIAAGTANAGTTAVSHTTLSAVAATTAPPPVDHQLCYVASGTFHIPGGIKLINQFSPNGFVPVINPALSVHCNPVQKTVVSTGKVYPITNPNAHLACFPLTAPVQPTPAIAVTNQFGTATLQPAQPNLLCVPSWKSLTGPPNMTPTTPPNLNHFTCYPVTVTSGAYHPPAITLKDEFAPAPVAATVNPVPSELCMPTEKILPTGQVFPIINPGQFLLCYPVSPTPVITHVWDENQFGTSAVTVSTTKWLCPPST